MSCPDVMACEAVRGLNTRKVRYLGTPRTKPSSISPPYYVFSHALACASLPTLAYILCEQPFPKLHIRFDAFRVRIWNTPNSSTRFTWSRLLLAPEGHSKRKHLAPENRGRSFCLPNVLLSWTCFLPNTLRRWQAGCSAQKPVAHHCLLA